MVEVDLVKNTSLLPFAVNDKMQFALLVLVFNDDTKRVADSVRITFEAWRRAANRLQLRVKTVQHIAKLRIRQLIWRLSDSSCETQAQNDGNPYHSVRVHRGPPYVTMYL